MPNLPLTLLDIFLSISANGLKIYIVCNMLNDFICRFAQVVVMVVSVFKQTLCEVTSAVLQAPRIGFTAILRVAYSLASLTLQYRRWSVWFNMQLVM